MKLLPIAMLAGIACAHVCAADKTCKKDQSVAADLRAQLQSDIQDEQAARLAAIEARRDSTDLVDKYFYTQDIFRCEERLDILRRKLNSSCS